MAESNTLSERRKLEAEAWKLEEEAKTLRAKRWAESFHEASKAVKNLEVIIAMIIAVLLGPGAVSKAWPKPPSARPSNTMPQCGVTTPEMQGHNRVTLRKR
jgi:hypothetical protein